jgi:hypothetical protein
MWLPAASERRLLYIEKEVWVRPPIQGQSPLRSTGSNPTQARVVLARLGIDPAKGPPRQPPMR